MLSFLGVYLEFSSSYIKIEKTETYVFNFIILLLDLYEYQKWPLILKEDH
jgi:hypothetical protein